MENKAIELLKKLRGYVNPSSGNIGYGAIATNAVYIHPAQALRNEADAIEAKEKLLKEIDEFLKDNA